MKVRNVARGPFPFYPYIYIHSDTIRKPSESYKFESAIRCSMCVCVRVIFDSIGNGKMLFPFKAIKLVRLIY